MNKPREFDEDAAYKAVCDIPRIHVKCFLAGAQWQFEQRQQEDDTLAKQNEILKNEIINYKSLHETNELCISNQHKKNQILKTALEFYAGPNWQFRMINKDDCEYKEMWNGTNGIYKGETGGKRARQALADAEKVGAK